MGFNSGFKGLIQTGTNHCVMRNAQEDMAIVTNRGTSQTLQKNEYKTQLYARKEH